MYIVQISNPQTAYIYDTHRPNPTPKGEIVGIFSAYDAKKVARLLNAERYGDSGTPPYKKPAAHRIIHRDVAARYIQRFGGRSEWTQIDVDNANLYLIDKDGERRGQVFMIDKFTSSVDATLDTIPF